MLPHLTQLPAELPAESPLPPGSFSRQECRQSTSPRTGEERVLYSVSVIDSSTSACHEPSLFVKEFFLGIESLCGCLFRQASHFTQELRFPMKGTKRPVTEFCSTEAILKSLTRCSVAGRIPPVDSLPYFFRSIVYSGRCFRRSSLTISERSRSSMREAISSFSLTSRAMYKVQRSCKTCGF